ncbi:Protection of telomeres protein 1 [Penicillium subrubescens]|uniref:Protection of telomeres protein 1 n=1 Tax=Penicillium subrubescens TaxID=1316194 RepID=A0A1Q5T9K2_9EURO|nr:Protection of telomeres protein 1 [Penicillium subrubescens]
MASSELVDITTACSRRGYLTTVGVVVDVLPPYRTKGSSACVTFTLKDCHFDGASWYGGLKIKYFNDRMDALPPVQRNDVVLLRNVRINMFNDKPTGVASQHDTVPWAILRSDSDPSSTPEIYTGPTPFSLQPPEKRAALTLLEGVATTAPATVTQPARKEAVPQQRSQVVQASMTTSPPSRGLPLQLIQDLQPGPFVQILGQVVKMSTLDSEKCFLHLTDYTSNESLTDIRKDGEDEMGTEGDNYDYLSRKRKNWPGPWGKMTIQVVLWEPHATFARGHVKEGQLVLLTYTRIKPGNYSGLEAVVHQDKRYPNKIHIQLISNDDNRATELMERRKEYWKIHGKPSEDPKKTAKKKKNEQKKKKEKTEEGQKPLSLPAPGKINKSDYILSGASHINTIPGGISYQLPFQNVCYRPSQVRVVDFFPPKLEDFTVQVPVTSTAAAGDDGHGPTSTPRMEWEWRFCLLVEGTEPLISNQARAQMKLFVTGGEAVHLLNLDPDE